MPTAISSISGYPLSSSPENNFPDNLREQLKEGAPQLKNPEYMEYPVVQYESEIMDLIIDHEEFVLVGETGSAKSTAFPIMLNEYRKVAEAEGIIESGKIAITQPRQLAAKEVSKRIAHIHGCALGTEVGYQIKDDNQTQPDTDINVMTEGILLRKLETDPLLDEYSIIMIDEAHERSADTDFLVGLIKGVNEKRRIANRPKIRLAVTSATIEKEKFTNYFAKDKKGKNSLEVPGTLHPVSESYLDEDVTDYTQAAADKVMEILGTRKPLPKSGNPEDMLIFMPGKGEINQTINKIKAELEKLGKGTSDHFEILPLHAEVTSAEQQRAINQKMRKTINGRPVRKIIVATNVAETSLTIEGIRHVIDSGLIRQTMYDEITGIESLETVLHARSGLRQRKGRAGRREPGEYHALFTKKSLESKERPEFQVPEILRKDPLQLILRMKRLGIADISKFPFIDKLPLQSVTSAIEKLKILGALDTEGRITRDGELISDLEVKPEWGKMIIEAQKNGCVEPICKIVALLGTRNLFRRPKITGDKKLDAEERQKANNKHYLLKNSSSSDFEALINILDAFDNVPSLPEYAHISDDEEKRKQWANDNDLTYRAFIQARRNKNDLLKTLRRRGIPYQNTVNNADLSQSIYKSVVPALIASIMVRSPVERAHNDRRSPYFRRLYSDLGDGRVIESIRLEGSSVVKALISGEFLVSDRVLPGKTRDEGFAELCQRGKIEDLPNLVPNLCQELISDKKNWNSVERTTRIVLQGTELDLVQPRTEKISKEEAKRRDALRLQSQNPQTPPRTRRPNPLMRGRGGRT